MKILQSVRMYIGWEGAFHKARGANGPVVVNKNNVGPIPQGFNLKWDFGNLYRSYKREYLNETIIIREFPTHFTVHARNNNLTALGHANVVEPDRTPGLVRQSGSNQNQLSGTVAGSALFIGGSYALWRALRYIFGEPVPEKTYKLFISHSWSYEDQYERLKEMLDDISGFEFLDYSVRREDPLDAQSRSELRRQLTSKIKQTSAVVIISGMYATYSDIIEMEIDIANELGKPIIGVKPWGNKQIPGKVQEEADVIVGWNAQSIANAVKEHA